MYDALRLIGLVIVFPFNEFARKSELLSQVFRFTKSKRIADERTAKANSAHNSDESKDDDAKKAPKNYKEVANKYVAKNPRTGQQEVATQKRPRRNRHPDSG